jgi:hypothetical protein
MAQSRGALGAGKRRALASHAERRMGLSGGLLQRCNGSDFNGASS